MSTAKTALISFKVERSIAELVDRLPNKSEFIRNAVLASLMNTCPLCQGKGVLTPEQKEHWERFAEHHRIERCAECDAVVVACDVAAGERRRTKTSKGHVR